MQKTKCRRCKKLRANSKFAPCELLPRPSNKCARRYCRDCNNASINLHYSTPKGKVKRAEISKRYWDKNRAELNRKRRERYKRTGQ